MSVQVVKRTGPKVDRSIRTPAEQLAELCADIRDAFPDATQEELFMEFRAAVLSDDQLKDAALEWAFWHYASRYEVSKRKRA